MNVHTGAPSAADLEVGQFIHASTTTAPVWRLYEVHEFNALIGCKATVIKDARFGSVRSLENVRKWAHCEGPMESPELND